jgi:hypothetical protein
MLTYGVMLLHDNALPHTSTAARTRALLEHFNWELFDHLLYSPDLAPSDYHSNEELMEGIKTRLSSQAEDFFDAGIQNLIPPYKCLNSGGDYVEK